MLLFRDEEHAKAWREARHLESGASMPLQVGWQLAKAWYADTLDPGWHWRTAAEAETIFASLGLTGDFWRLGGR